MANGLPPDADAKFTTLVTGIINDAQRLFHQQVELVRSEIQSDFKRTKEASQILALGVGAAIVASVLVALTAVHLIAWATEWPLWICYGAVAGVLAVVAISLLTASIRKFQAFNPLPDESIEGLKENIQWKTNLT